MLQNEIPRENKATLPYPVAITTVLFTIFIQEKRRFGPQGKQHLMGMAMSSNKTTILNQEQGSYYTSTSLNVLHHLRLLLLSALQCKLAH